MKTLLISWIAFTAATTVVHSQTAADAIAKADAHERKGESREALEDYMTADRLTPNRAEILVKIAKQHGDLMTEAKSAADRKKEGEISLAYSRQALQADPSNSDAHLAVAISIGKLVEFAGNREKVESSREIKAQADRALELNPKSDYAHHLLGRWNQELADMNAATKIVARLIYGALPSASYDDALAHFQKARDLRPDRLIHAIEYGRTLAMMGRKAEARTALNKALAMPNRDKDDEAAKQRGRETLKGL